MDLFCHRDQSVYQSIPEDTITGDFNLSVAFVLRGIEEKQQTFWSQQTTT